MFSNYSIYLNLLQIDLLGNVPTSDPNGPIAIPSDNMSALRPDTYSELAARKAQPQRHPPRGYLAAIPGDHLEGRPQGHPRRAHSSHHTPAHPLLRALTCTRGRGSPVLHTRTSSPWHRRGTSTHRHKAQIFNPVRNCPRIAARASHLSLWALPQGAPQTPAAGQSAMQLQTPLPATVATRRQPGLIHRAQATRQAERAASSYFDARTVPQL